MPGGIEIPSDGDATKEAYLRTAIGTTFAQDRGFGRAWSPQVEVLWARPFGEQSEWDVVPQLQVSLSKLQHVLLTAAVTLWVFVVMRALPGAQASAPTTAPASHAAMHADDPAPVKRGGIPGRSVVATDVLGPEPVGRAQAGE